MKIKMEQIAAKAGLTTKTKSKEPEFHIVNRIAIEEIEAWFLGDEQALCSSYPSLRGLPGQYQRRPPDHIANSWEVLEKLLKDAGYRSIGGKIEVARKISQNMTPETNRSKSFNAFVAAIKACL